MTTPAEAITGGAEGSFSHASGANDFSINSDRVAAAAASGEFGYEGVWTTSQGGETVGLDATQDSLVAEIEDIEQYGASSPQVDAASPSIGSPSLANMNDVNIVLLLQVETMRNLRVTRKLSGIMNILTAKITSEKFAQALVGAMYARQQGEFQAAMQFAAVVQAVYTITGTVQQLGSSLKSLGKMGQDPQLRAKINAVKKVEGGLPEIQRRREANVTALADARLALKDAKKGGASRKEIKKLKGEVQRLEGKVKEGIHAVEGNFREGANTNRTAKALKKVGQAKEAVATTERVVTHIKGTIKTAKTQLAQKKGELPAAQAKLERATEKLQGLEAQISAGTGDVAAARVELAGARAELKTAKAEVKKIEGEIKTLEKTITREEKHLGKEETRLGEEREALGEAETELENAITEAETGVAPESAPADREKAVPAAERQVVIEPAADATRATVATTERATVDAPASEVTISEVPATRQPTIARPAATAQQQTVSTAERQIVIEPAAQQHTADRPATQQQAADRPAATRPQEHVATVDAPVENSPASTAQQQIVPAVVAPVDGRPAATRQRDLAGASPVQRARTDAPPAVATRDLAGGNPERRARTDSPPSTAVQESLPARDALVADGIGVEIRRTETPAAHRRDADTSTQAKQSADQADPSRASTSVSHTPARDYKGEISTMEKDLKIYEFESRLTGAMGQVIGGLYEAIAQLGAAQTEHLKSRNQALEKHTQSVGNNMAQDRKEMDDFHRETLQNLDKVIAQQKETTAEIFRQNFV